MIRVLGIVASPRRKGNSAFLMDQSLGAAAAVSPSEVEVEAYSLAGKNLAPCRACLRCKGLGGECAIADDFQVLRDKWMEADVILYSVPVYHMGVPAQLKCFMDRLGSSTSFYFKDCPEGPKLLKPVGAVVQGMHFAAGQELTMMAIIAHALIMGCLPVTGDQWQCYIGAGGWTRNDISHHALKDLHAEGEVSAKAVVAGAASLGRRAVELALLLQGGLRTRGDIVADQPVYAPALDTLADVGEGGH